MEENKDLCLIEDDCTIINVVNETGKDNNGKDIKDDNKPNVEYLRHWCHEENVFYIADNKTTIIDPCGNPSNSFIHAALEAYNTHKGLSLTPDMIHFLLLSILSIVVNKYPDNFRDVFVKHDNKRIIVIETGSVYSWENDVIKKFSQKVSQQIDTDKLGKFKPSFSTSTEISNLCFDVAMLSTLKQYFEYRLVTKCYIPSFKLYGKAEDWEKLYDIWSEFLVLMHGKLPTYTSQNLKIILENFKNAVAGEPDYDFFKNFMNAPEHRGSGAPYLSGYIKYLVPYDKEGCFYNYEKKTIRDIHDFPTCLFKTPIIWTVLTDNIITETGATAIRPGTYDIDINACFTGMKFEEKEKGKIYFYPVFNAYISTLKKIPDFHFIDLNPDRRLETILSIRQTNRGREIMTPQLVEKLDMMYKAFRSQTIKIDEQEKEIAMENNIDTRTLRRLYRSYKHKKLVKER